MTLLLSNAPLPAYAQGAVDAADYAVWRDNFGASASESVELFLYNKCKQGVTMQLVFAPGGTQTVELVPFEPKAGPIPIPLPTGGDVRGHTLVKASVEPGPCTRNGRGLVMLAAAVSDSSGMVVHEAGLRSDGDLVQSVAEGAPERAKRASVDIVKIGTGQTAEIAVVNRCRHDVIFRVRTFMPGVSDRPKGQSVVVPGGKNAVVPLSDVGEGWVEIATSARQVAKAKRRNCRTGDVSAGIDVFAAGDGDTGVSAALLLPAIQAARE